MINLTYNDIGSCRNPLTYSYVRVYGWRRKCFQNHWCVQSRAYKMNKDVRKTADGCQKNPACFWPSSRWFNKLRSSLSAASCYALKSANPAGRIGLKDALEGDDRLARTSQKSYATSQNVTLTPKKLASWWMKNVPESASKLCSNESTSLAQSSFLILEFYYLEKWSNY